MAGSCPCLILQFYGGRSWLNWLSGTSVSLLTRVACLGRLRSLWVAFRVMARMLATLSVLSFLAASERRLKLAWPVLVLLRVARSLVLSLRVLAALLALRMRKRSLRVWAMMLKTLMRLWTAPWLRLRVRPSVLVRLLLRRRALSLRVLRRVKNLRAF